jgi:hypothetical protein
VILDPKLSGEFSISVFLKLGGVMATALVTGKSTGIGLATVVNLGRAGHFVYATMRNPDGGGDLREVIEAEDLPVTIVALDVDDDDSVALKGSIACRELLVYHPSAWPMQSDSCRIRGSFHWNQRNAFHRKRRGHLLGEW